MNLSVWKNLGGTAWRTATPKEQVFLAFCMAFEVVSGETTRSESDYWEVALKAETKIREYLVENSIQIIKQDDFDLSIISDGMLTGREIRTVQAHYGILICGTAFEEHDLDESERKYQKAIRISERLAVMGCSGQDNLPYFNAAKHLDSLE